MNTIQRSAGFFLILFISVAIFPSCSKYQKVLNGDDMEQKLEYAETYYENNQHSRALALLDEIYRFYVGTEKGEKVTFYLAYSNYHLKNFLLASYYFKKLADSYPRGEHAEESMYMYAYTQYLNSPQADLDQSNTRGAIEAFQFFVNRFPDSDRVDEANRYMDVFRDKLQRKTFNAAMAYYQIMDYKAAAFSLKAALEEYPAIENRDEVEILILESYYKLAENSVETKQAERYMDTIEVYQEFIERYPDSKFRKEATDIYEKALQNLDDINSKKI
ncbi:MAG: outer membrane protein assembly factor BamD [Bacteroidia bacterium]